jgi:glutathione S-transferase
MFDARESRMQLYWWPKTRSLRALWMLEEVGCPYERVPVNITQGGQKDPAFLAVNPMGKLPALADGEAKLAESAAICAYLADKFPEAGLAPPVGDARRGRYLHWLFGMGLL